MTKEQDKKLDELKEVVRIRMCEPYHDRALDLLLYKFQYARGVRISDIDRLIADAINEIVPRVGKG